MRATMPLLVTTNVGRTGCTGTYTGKFFLRKHLIIYVDIGIQVKYGKPPVENSGVVLQRDNQPGSAPRFALAPSSGKHHIAVERRAGESLFPQTGRPEMGQIPRIRIDDLHQQIHFRIRQLVVFAPTLPKMHLRVERPHCPVRNIHAKRFDDGSQEAHSLIHPRETYFGGMYPQMQFFLQKCGNHRNQHLQKASVGVNDIEIVHIPSVVPATQFPLYKLIQRIQEHVRKQLRSQIADRQPYTRNPGKPQALFSRESFPFPLVPDDQAVLHRIAKQNAPHQEVYHPVIHTLLPRPICPWTNCESSALYSVAQNLVKYLFVNTHEVSPNIQLQGPSRQLPVLRTRADMMCTPPYSLEGPFPEPTRITVVDKRGLQHRIQVIEQEMVHHPVREGRSERPRAIQGRVS